MRKLPSLRLPIRIRCPGLTTSVGMDILRICRTDFDCICDVLAIHSNLALRFGRLLVSECHCVDPTAERRVSSVCAWRLPPSSL